MNRIGWMANGVIALSAYGLATAGHAARSGGLRRLVVAAALIVLTDVLIERGLPAALHALAVAS